jgi:hypothetical protein
VAQAYNFVALVYNTVCMCYRYIDKQWGRCLKQPMNPICESKLTRMVRALRDSKLTGTVSVELGFKAGEISGSLKFKRQLSQKEAEFCKDVIDTALINALACLKNRVELESPERNARRDSDGL